MCSYWRSHDDGDLEAVVRGYSRIHGAAPAPAPPPPKKIADDGKNLHQKFNDFYQDVPNTNSNGGFSALSIDYGNNDSEMLFSSLSMDLQHVCNPFYKETLLRQSTSVFENKMMKIERSSPVEVALSNPRSSITVTKPSPRSSPVKEAESRVCVETGGKTQPPPPPASSSSSSSKRRKAQQKRIVCVPVTGGGANSGNSNRPNGGEGVPSDLWAWRKYGQKPIKGSPYPRGYYRCSSSKGCSARKQVERSRTDPNMLVITYTSDHNHPWPTHRNALAGSTRQTSSEKSNSINNEADNTSTMQGQNPRGESPPNNTIVEDHHHETTTTSSGSPIATPPAADIPLTPDINPSTTIISQQQSTSVSYFPEHYEDLFADLGELPDSLDVFTKNFTQQNHGHNNNSKATTTKTEDEETCNNVVDPFHLFNWSSPSTTSSSSSSYANSNTTFLQAKSSSM